MKENRMTLLQKLRAQHGSALLVSLMVIVGLSILGLGFVALSETEAAIAVNQRNREQTLSHAESAANEILDWFQNPQWALSKGLMPANDSTNTELAAMKTNRTLTASPSYTGKYKPSSTEYLCDLSFTRSPSDRFYGDENHADILINTTTAPIFLAAFNTALFPDTTEGGAISEIKIYAPPVVGGTTNGNGFVEGGDRYGVATIKVTAEKKDVTGRVSARRFVKLVVTEFPFPGPNGPIQSNSSISVTGSFEVYWGEVSSRTNLTYKVVGSNPSAVKGIPWSDAWNRVEIEHGYDSSDFWQPNHKYNPGDVVHASATRLTAALRDHAFKFIATTPCTTGPAASEPSWDPTQPGRKYNQTAGTCSGGNEWQEVPATMYPNFSDDTVRNTDRYNWLWTMLNAQFNDPWAQGRSRGVITNSGNSNYLANGSYSDPTVSPTSTYFNWFQQQTTDNAPLQKTVNFPFINYDFWKQIAQAGDDGISPVHYLKYDAGTGNFYKPAAPGKKFPFETWVNSCTGVTNPFGVGTQPLGPGFYFFDTTDGANPQPPTGSGTNLTPTITVKANTMSPCFCMKGFIYLNTVEFGTTGAPKGEANKYYNYPGDPYRDVGYRAVDTATGLFKRDAAGNLAPLTNANNNNWDYQDVNGNGTFDYVLRDIRKDSQGNTITPNPTAPNGTAFTTATYVPVEYYEGCTIGTNCSEPHEPYFNIIYPQVGTTSAASPSPTAATFGWEAPASQTRLAKEPTTTAYTAVTDCSVVANQSKCTSNGYDDKGPLCQLGNGGPMLEGVLYNEGVYNAHGNAVYYGSLLIQGDVTGNGTPTVYFDESLVKSDFKKKFKDFPRVYVSAQQTDEQ